MAIVLAVVRITVSAIVLPTGVTSIIPVLYQSYYYYYYYCYTSVTSIVAPLRIAIIIAAPLIGLL